VNGGELIARGDPVGISPEVVTVAVAVVAFWLLVGAALLAIWFARRRRAAAPEERAHAEHQHREHMSFVEGLRLGDERRSPAITRGRDGRVVLYPELSGKARTTGRRRRHGKRRAS
jgi:hypothetical protein